MKLELVIKDEARFEIMEAYRYYENVKPGLGEIFFDFLNVCFDGIRLNPLRYPMKKRPYREALVKKFPFVVIFETIDDQVVVYSVFNSWRNPTKKP
jgi:hypothetical protein